jgi:hypothetical protein
MKTGIRPEGTGTMRGQDEAFSSSVAVHDWNDGLLFDNSGNLWGYRFNSHLQY